MLLNLRPSKEEVGAKQKRWSLSVVQSGSYLTISKAQMWAYGFVWYRRGIRFGLMFKLVAKKKKIRRFYPQNLNFKHNWKKKITMLGLLTYKSTE